VTAVARGRGPSGRTDGAKLRLFCDRVAYTIARPAATDGTLNARFTVNFSADGPSTLEQQPYDEDAVTALLAAFRKFHLANEDVFFTHITGIVGRYVQTDPELADANAGNRQQWLKLGRHSSINVIVNGTTRAPLDWYDLWVNGGLFHDGAEHEGVYEGLDPMTQATVRNLLFGMVGYQLRTLHAERNLIEEGFRRGLFPD
jgi:hypothetical protein